MSYTAGEIALYEATNARAEQRNNADRLSKLEKRVEMLEMEVALFVKQETGPSPFTREAEMNEIEKIGEQVKRQKRSAKNDRKRTSETGYGDR